MSPQKRELLSPAIQSHVAMTDPISFKERPDLVFLHEITSLTFSDFVKYTLGSQNMSLAHLQHTCNKFVMSDLCLLFFSSM